MDAAGARALQRKLDERCGEASGRRLDPRPEAAGSSTGRRLPVYGWTGAAAPEPGGERLCSLGCHRLPEGAKFDPHNGMSLTREASAVSPRHRAWSRRLRG